MTLGTGLFANVAGLFAHNAKRAMTLKAKNGTL